MDWLWGLYREHITRAAGRAHGKPDAQQMQAMFLDAVGASTATLYVMEPVGDTIRFKGLGRWPLPEVPALLADPNAFIADHFGGGKYKVNFHHGATFVGTHNFRTYGDERWRAMEDLLFE
jgi:hypothetical protein